MTPVPGDLTVRIAEGMDSVDTGAWDALARLPGTSPFMESGFLASIEETGCAAPETGWYPRHFLVESAGRLVGAAPAYVKTHSMGEFVFDQGLAAAASELGCAYYPKLVATQPFVPSPGYRFLVDPDEDEAAVGALLLGAMADFAGAERLSSRSVLFADPRWEATFAASAAAAAKEAAGSDGGSGDGESQFLRWAHQYFLWENRGYADFDGFVSAFGKNQRRNIRRERASVAAAGIRTAVLAGDDLTPSVMEAMYRFYLSTNENFGPWAAFYLNREWFLEIAGRWKDRILVFAAYEEGLGEPAAMSLVVRKGEGLYGRYWGTDRFIRNLHFELCYYAPLEYAIENGIRFFDPGMGSPHKARRGFESREFASFHAISDSRLAALLESVLPEANRAERAAIRELDSSVPWKSRGPEPGGV